MPVRTSRAALTSLKNAISRRSPVSEECMSIADDGAGRSVRCACPTPSLNREVGALAAGLGMQVDPLVGVIHRLPDVCAHGVDDGRGIDGRNVLRDGLARDCFGNG